MKTQSPWGALQLWAFLENVIGEAQYPVLAVYDSCSLLNVSLTAQRLVSKISGNVSIMSHSYYTSDYPSNLQLFCNLL